MLSLLVRRPHSEVPGAALSARSPGTVRGGTGARGPRPPPGRTWSGPRRVGERGTPPRRAAARRVPLLPGVSPVSALSSPLVTVLCTRPWVRVGVTTVIAVLAGVAPSPPAARRDRPPV